MNDIFQAFPGIPFVEVGQHKIPLEITPLTDVVYSADSYFPFPKGVLAVKGADRLSFLQGITTNDVLQLKEGEGMRSLFTANSGHILFDTFIYKFSEYLFIITDPGDELRLSEFLQFYHIIEDIKIEDLTGKIQVFYLFSENADYLNSFNAITEVNTFSVLSGLHLIFASVETNLIDLIQTKNITPIGLEAFELLRPIIGLSRAGMDFNKDFLPNEASLEGAVSFTKGCFVGQEPIARIKHRGRPTKILSQFITSTPVNISDKIFSAGKEVGVVTTAPSLKTDQGFFCLGYIKNMERTAEKENLTIGEVRVVEMIDVNGYLK